MEEDEDTYGFGSFSDLFAAAPAAAKHLDVGALSRFCVPERVLSRWQQQRRDSCSVSYQHVAAKFDGVSIDGGLGALSFASLEGGGVVWQQTAATDSDALERRKKELQDITNQPQNDVKSAAAVFVKLEQVEAVQATSVQNKVQGVEMLLKDGNRLEVAFMPGPFYKATHRDEFLALLKEKVTTEREGNEATQNGLTGGLKIQLGEAGGNNTVEVRGRRMPAGEEDSVKKEKFRKLVRRYTQLDELSSEALIIAKQVQEGTGYHLGPTAKDIPKFSADAAYRKKTIVELTGYVERMNQEWKEADRQRELHTKAKHSRNDDDLFEYTDTDTGEQVPVRTYEQRYLTFVKAHEVNPVLHLCPVPEKKTHDEVSLKARKAVLVAPAPQRSTLTASPKANENLRRLSSMFTATLGIDISSSCVIDKDFFSPAAALTQSDVPAHRNEDKAFRAIVDNARVQLWNSWRDAFVQACNDRTHEVSRQHHDEYQSKMTSVDKKVSSSARKKRGRDRRRSIILPTSVDLQFTVGAALPPADTNSDSMNGKIAAQRGESEDFREKRARATSQPAEKSKRKIRRQSIVSSVSLPSMLASEKEVGKGVKTPRGHSTQRNTFKSPRQLATNGYSRETSALEMVGNEDSNVCQLCCSSPALVHMNPCDHTVCVSCWGRLTPSSGKDDTGSGTRRMCPWDREIVTKR